MAEDSKIEWTMHTFNLWKGCMKPTFAEHFGQRIKAVRASKGLSQKKLSEDAGISVGFLSDVENGKRSVSLINAVNIAHALGVPLSVLIER